MIQTPFTPQETPDVWDALDVLTDPVCRTLIRNLDHPMTAREIAVEFDILLSTTYRKLDRLTDTALITETTRLRLDGSHASQYMVAFDELHVRRTNDNELAVHISSIDHPANQLASIESAIAQDS